MKKIFVLSKVKEHLLLVEIRQAETVPDADADYFYTDNEQEAHSLNYLENVRNKPEAVI